MDTRRALAALSAATMLVAGCARQPRDPQPSPEPTSTVRLGTVARAEAGSRLTVTATVDRVITGTAFVVRDVDFTDGTLLVLSAGPDIPEPPQLVTVVGTVVDFSYRDLSGRYELGPSGPYRDFEGGRALVAGDVTVWK
ncbi:MULTISPECIES: hypothetical protein [unclassified Micromonospora]|uniref:hypothetical protein n=1 Tax=unclassified Micromonospora TaxID=2617518 RepID=UPI001C212804|nr:MULTISPECIES: hypothetical protein [unclassified Micromonospora]MBU8861528.1 hypothetical protein [Micromonospora sp. WMMB482]MBU8861863.1 hypothetical protein [Micromonospora sp. WMMB482]MBU8861869.1 hypothetical protein [Micromonospora sp. WMMB482]MDM4781096.1 hypothetical protein [Micromonospora sp. b486]